MVEADGMPVNLIVFFALMSRFIILFERLLALFTVVKCRIFIVAPKSVIRCFT